MFTFQRNEVRLTVSFKVGDICSDENSFAENFDGCTGRTKKQAIAEVKNSAKVWGDFLRAKYPNEVVSVWDNDGNCY